MENNNQKWVNLTFLAASALIGYVVFAALFKLAGVYDFESQVKNVDLVIRMSSLVLGALLFFGLYKSEAANQFMHEVVAELTRVTWPTQKETVSATFIVVIMVLVTGVLLGLVDKFWTLVIQWIL
jgi:preprotein translocase subunit SecE